VQTRRNSNVAYRPISISDFHNAIVFLTSILICSDAHILYRLVGQKMTPQAWASVFGGGTKKVLQVATSSQYPLPGSYASVG
jgi:hypothetical protein